MPSTITNKLIIIAAPSGAGKTSVTKHLLKAFPDKLAFSISCATRLPRNHEKDKVDYYFIPVEAFKNKIQQQEFVEWEMVYEGKYYGTLKSELERIWQQQKTPLLDVDVKGGINIQQQYPYDSLTLFIEPPSIEELERRLKVRGTETPESLQARINKASYELSFKQQFDHCIINNKLEMACAEAEEAVRVVSKPPNPLKGAYGISDSINLFLIGRVLRSLPFRGDLEGLFFYLRVVIHLNSILLFFLALLLMGFFAGIEMAFYSANRLSIEIKKNQAGSSTQTVSKFIESPVRFLGATLIGFNIFLVFLGLQISTVMAPVWNYLNVGSPTVHLIVEIALATFVVLLFAEFIPRALFRAKSYTLLTRLAGITDFFYQLFYPVGSLLIDLSEWILKYVFNIRLNKNKESITRSDLKHLFQQTTDNERQERNTQLMENAQELPKVKIRQCLVPRKEIIGIDIRSTIEEVKKKFVETKLSKLVVFENNIDHITGYIHQLDLFKKPASIQPVLLPIPAVPESMSAADLITKFTKERKSIAWVVDEFGGTAGIITMEDVLEELFGEIQDEYDTEEFVEKQLAENEYMFSGRLELDYLEEKYGFHFDKEESETLSGYIINYHETIPNYKERIIIDDYEFDIMHVSDTRIEMVKMKKLK